MVLRTIFLLILVIHLISIHSKPPETPYPLPIRVGLAVDDKSVRDLLIVINSVLTSAYERSDIVFHVVACGSDLNEAKALVDSINESIKQCFPTILNTRVVPFTLPRESGFYLQMINAKTKSHWTSSTGADMARFFFASIFPDVERILYIDNDVLVTCCLEEIWATEIKPNQVVGIALDDLNWATVTQFNRQYNASHPLVSKNIRRSSSDLSPLTEKEFSDALPRYPNDGVLLIDVKNYNKMKILETIDEIAMANGRGEYVVGLGTQQFTVLGMHDKWIEITPRANLRHFPDMARGYLMWFLYNGLIHYAGQAKPRQYCTLEGQVDNEHRVRTYVPWVTNVHELHERCPSESSKSLHADGCWQHVPTPRNIIQYLDVIDKTVDSTRDSSLIYLKIGDGFDRHDTRHSKYLESLDCFPKIVNYVKISEKDPNDSNIGRRLHNPICSHDLISLIDMYVLYNSSWSGRIYHASEDSKHQTERLLVTLPYARQVYLQTTYLNDIKRRPGSGTAGGYDKKGKKKAVKPPPQAPKASSRDWKAINVNYCNYIQPFKPGKPPVKNSADCVSILDDIKSKGKKHWDVMGISIDVLPTEINNQHSSIGILRALDMEFIRAKFIIVKLYGSSETYIEESVKETKEILHRNGYMVLEGPRANNGRLSSYVLGTFTSIFDFPVITDK